MLDDEPRLRWSRHSRQWPWISTALITIAGIATVSLLVVIVKHHDAQLPKKENCPKVTTVDRTLGMHVAAPSAVSVSDLLGCFYPEGHDPQAVSVTFARPDVRGASPCRHRPRIVVAGAPGCDVSRSRGTSRTGHSLLVDARLQYQFSSDRGSVTLVQLEHLAATVLARPPPPV